MSNFNLPGVEDIEKDLARLIELGLVHELEPEPGKVLYSLSPALLAPPPSKKAKR